MPNEQRREQNTEKAIAAAKQLLHEEGAAQLTMQKIAQTAGISQRTLNRFYHSKDELIEMITLDYCRNGFSEAKDYCRKRHIAEKNGLEQLQIFFESVKLHFTSIAHQIVVITDAQTYLRKGSGRKADINPANNIEKNAENSFESNAENNTGSRRVVEPHMKNFKEYEVLVYTLLERGEEDGSIKKEDSDKHIRANLIVNTFWGMIIQLTTAYYSGFYSLEYCNKLFDEYSESICRQLSK